jgi:hypothetical protein
MVGAAGGLMLKTREKGEDFGGTTRIRVNEGGL